MPQTVCEPVTAVGVETAWTDWMKTAGEMQYLFVSPGTVLGSHIPDAHVAAVKHVVVQVPP
jgi:hypothetical protein